MNQLECRPTEKRTYTREELEAMRRESDKFDARIINTTMTVIAIALITLILASCGSSDISKTTHIRDTTYKIVPPAIIDSGVMEIRILPLNPPPKGDSVFIPASVDTIYQYARISGGDTTVRIMFVPRTRWVYYKIKPDTIYYTARDTLTKYETKETVIETPWMAKVGIFSYGIISVLMVGLIIYLINWYKYGRAKPVIIEADNDDGLP